ncbi:unnamed protein product [Calypogeia fissa]
MEASAVMHCGALRDYRLSSAGVLTAATTPRSGSGRGLRLPKKEKFGSSSISTSSSVCCLRAGEFSSFRPPILEWHSLHLCSPTSTPSRRRVIAFSQRAGPSAKCGIANEKETLIDEEQKVLLKKKADAIVRDLRGTCIFLVGMMGSGKTTVGKYIADALGYYFFDSDKLVEDAAGGITVQQMFREGNEEEFRNAESEVLMQLSSMGRLVVATGGGAVVRPQNWGYLRHGITVWLDVPVDALARRVVAVGCESRPLLGQVSPETAYHQALNCLENLFEQRVDYYKHADTCVSVAGLATRTGLDDIGAVTPSMLAAQVLDEIAVLIRKRRKYPGDHPGNF